MRNSAIVIEPNIVGAMGSVSELLRGQLAVMRARGMREMVTSRLRGETDVKVWNGSVCRGSFSQSACFCRLPLLFLNGAWVCWCNLITLTWFTESG